MFTPGRAGGCWSELLISRFARESIAAQLAVALKRASGIQLPRHGILRSRLSTRRLLRTPARFPPRRPANAHHESGDRDVRNLRDSDCHARLDIARRATSRKWLVHG